MRSVRIAHAVVGAGLALAPAAVHAGDGRAAVVSDDPADAVRAALSRELRVGHCFSEHGGALACPETGCAFVVSVDVDVDGAVVAARVAEGRGGPLDECLTDAARALMIDLREAAVDVRYGLTWVPSGAMPSIGDPDGGDRRRAPASPRPGAAQPKEP